MISTADPAEVVRSVAAGVSALVAGHLTPSEEEQQLDALAALYAENTDVRYPFMPLGDSPLQSRDELRHHFAQAAQRTKGATEFVPSDFTVHRTPDPEVVIVEFRYVGRAHDRPFALPCIFVARVRNGEIVESRDYGDHLGLARTFGRLDPLLDQLRETA